MINHIKMIVKKKVQAIEGIFHFPFDDLVKCR